MFLPTPGALVANRFRLRHAIGKGGMGQVWEAHDRELDSPCAIKFIVDHMAQDPEARLRIVREARAVARLRSPHVVTILGVGEHADAMYLAMELLEGETLASRLERSGKLDLATSLELAEQVALVLDKAHGIGIVHRDLKPDNLWLSAGPKLFIKVLDFGVAKSTQHASPHQTASGALMGTPQYMSPEHAKGDREVDHRCDLWAFAIIAMECLSGRRPFDSPGLGDLLMKIMNSPPPSVQELDASLPASLAGWWQRALARDPNQRFQSASELVHALRFGLTTSPVGQVTPVLGETNRGSWTAPPPATGGLPARVATLVTTITPMPVSGPLPSLPPSQDTIKILGGRGAAGTSVSPVSKTARGAPPRPRGRRKLLLGTGLAALLMALVALSVVTRGPRGSAISSTQALSPVAGAAEPESNPPAAEPLAPAAPPTPLQNEAAPGATAQLEPTPRPEPTLERTPPPEANESAHHAARVPTNKAPRKVTPARATGAPGAGNNNEKLKARLGF